MGNGSNSMSASLSTASLSGGAGNQLAFSQVLGAAVADVCEAILSEAGVALVRTKTASGTCVWLLY